MCGICVTALVKPRYHTRQDVYAVCVCSGGIIQTDLWYVLCEDPTRDCVRKVCLSANYNSVLIQLLVVTQMQNFNAVVAQFFSVPICVTVSRG